MLVVEDEHLDVHALDGRGGQLLTVHQEGAVSVNVHHNLQAVTALSAVSASVFLAPAAQHEAAISFNKSVAIL